MECGPACRATVVVFWPHLEGLTLCDRFDASNITAVPAAYKTRLQGESVARRRSEQLQTREQVTLLRISTRP